MMTAGVLVYIAGVTIVLLVPVLAGVIVLRMLRRQRVSEATCGACRYPVAAVVGTTPRCPECGGLFCEVGVLGTQRRDLLPRIVGWGLVMVPVALCSLLIAVSLAGASRAAAARAAAAREAADAKAAAAAMDAAAQRGPLTASRPAASEAPDQPPEPPAGASHR
jgi:hypothetical protein